MTETNGGGAADDAAQPQTAMPGQDAQVAVQVNAQYVKDLSFENPGIDAVIKGQGQRSAPQTNVNLQVGAQAAGEDRYEVTLTVKLEGKSEEQPVFISEIVYAGLFTVKGLPQEHLSPFLYVECPRLLFPFARQILADTVRDGGLPPFLLPPVDFAALYRQQQAAQANQEPQGQA